MLRAARLIMNINDPVATTFPAPMRCRRIRDRPVPTWASLHTACAPPMPGAGGRGRWLLRYRLRYRPDQRVFDAARELGLPVKLHAEQRGGKLAAEYGALSVDHVEYANAEDAMAMAKSGSVAVLLPGAFYTLRETQKPPIAHFRAHGVPMAVATDCNPGSSPLASILLAMNMACTLFRLTPEEALAGATAHAARALGLSDTGEIEAGLRADLAIWNVARPAELSYRIGSPLFKRVFGARPPGRTASV